MTIPIDIIVLGMIAIFVALRLRSVLGKTSDEDPVTRFMQKKQSDTERAGAQVLQQAPHDSEKSVQDIDALQWPEKEVAPAAVDSVKAIIKKEAGFVVPSFLEGAKTAFDMVHTAFQKNDRDTLNMLLGKTVREAFITVLDARADEDTHEEHTLVAITDATIVEAALKGQTARLTVEFTSEQVHVTRDKDDVIVEGDPKEIHVIEDRWVFTRTLSTSDPTWLVDAT